jgi:hypothetical protein
LDYVVQFPRLVVQTTLKKRSGIQAVREILKNEKLANVTETPPGIVRITIGNVPSDILHTNISNLEFDADAQYNPDAALDAIVANKDIQSAMRSQNLQMPNKIINRLVVQPGTGRPHLPSTMSNVTMDKALDSIANRFGGIVLYGICPDNRTYSLEFAGGVYFDNSRTKGE